jgi:hypothetical protein
MTVEPSRPDELSSTMTAEPSTTTMTVEPSRPDELSSTTTAEPSTTTMTVEPSRPDELSSTTTAEPSTTTSRPRTMMPGDYAKNLFAFAFALGATFSFAIFYYCLVLFVALQDTQQVIENCSELS